MRSSVHPLLADLLHRHETDSATCFLPPEREDILRRARRHARLLVLAASPIASVLLLVISGSVWSLPVSLVLLFTAVVFAPRCEPLMRLGIEQAVDREREQRELLRSEIRAGLEETRREEVATIERLAAEIRRTCGVDDMELEETLGLAELTADHARLAMAYTRRKQLLDQVDVSALRGAQLLDEGGPVEAVVERRLQNLDRLRRELVELDRTMKAIVHYFHLLVEYCVPRVQFDDDLFEARFSSLMEGAQLPGLARPRPAIDDHRGLPMSLAPRESGQM